MLSCQYIQKGVLLSQPPLPIFSLLFLLQLSPPTLRHLHILCNDSGIEFVHTKAKNLFIDDILSPVDVPNCFKEFFTFDNTLSYAGHHKPLAAVQIVKNGFHFEKFSFFWANFDRKFR
ncbi:hypothetical protein LOK49_LG10G02067 [Camellia lanceoleosa]|uniref:Uncharacterized protein n=1 Tax=Camellia lanceoleosa TaxID=1840588 RepID=A0ACC0GAN0_9ERIC|nr:hypothetical protein LOK49_LG10G02067 [Camellia lanceoleosa]